MAKSYIKLGPRAESFSDPVTDLSLAGKEVRELTPKMASSARIKGAISGGHLSIATEQDYKVFMGIVEKEVETIESEFGTNAEELLKYYQDNYEVDKTMVKAFKKLSLQEMVDELTKLEDDEEKGKEKE